MRLQRYFPTRTAEQVLWLLNFRTKLPAHESALALTSEQLATAVADAGWVAYVLGTWEGAVRVFPKAASASIEQVQHGDGAPALPTFTAPPLPEGVVPVANGALERIFAQVARIKLSTGFTPAIAQDLGVATLPPGPARPVPKFRLDVEDGTEGQAVRISFSKYGHQAVVIESRRAGGPAEALPLAGQSPYTDSRPLLVAGQPEVREYRLRFWDKGEPNGPWTPWREIAVAP